MRRSLLALLMLSACATTNKPELTSPSRRPVNPDEKVELTLQTYPALAPWTLSSLRGKVVLLDVWATWCEPCRESLPLYVDLRKEFGRHGFEVIAINVDDDPIQIPLFLNEVKVDLPIVIDPHSVQSNKVLKVQVMPTTYLIDRKGVIRWVHEGFNEDMLSTWLDEIETLVAEKP